MTRQQRFRVRLLQHAWDLEDRQKGNVIVERHKERSHHINWQGSRDALVELAFVLVACVVMWALMVLDH